MARISLSELRTRASTVDQAKVEATTEAEILAQRAADPDAPSEVPTDARTVESPRALRVRLGMTQPEMAAALSIPLGTWRNWEQGRVSLEPAAAALLRVVSHDPATALTALAKSKKQDAPTAADGDHMERFIASEAPDTAAFRAWTWENLIHHAAIAAVGREFGKPDTPHTRRFVDLLQEPDVRAWLGEREQERAKSTRHD